LYKARYKNLVSSAYGYPVFPELVKEMILNAAKLHYMGHTKGRPCKGKIGQGKETKNLKVVDVLTVQE
jgi:hypothetical protein